MTKQSVLVPVLVNRCTIYHCLFLCIFIPATCLFWYSLWFNNASFSVQSLVCQCLYSLEYPSSVFPPHNAQKGVSCVTTSFVPTTGFGDMQTLMICP